MKMRKFMSRIAFTGTMILCMGIFAGCSSKSSEQALANHEESIASGGTLVLRVNPEIAIEYDADGRVTTVRGKNADGDDIVAGYQDYIGKECREVVSDLVGAIHQAGYFVEEVDGISRKITIEIETGSVIPQEEFLDEIVTDIQQYVKEIQVNSPVVLEGEKDYETTIYNSSDYGITAYDNTSYEIEVPLNNNSANTENPAPENTPTEPAPTPEPTTPESTATPTPAPVTPAVSSGTTDYSPYDETDYNDPATPYEATNYTPYEESAYTPYVPPVEATPAPTPEPTPAPVTPAASSGTTDYSPYDETDYHDPATPYEATNYSPYEETNYTPYEESAYSPYEESNYSDYD